MNVRSPARRGRLRRSLVLFALLLLGPAIGFSILGWNSVVHQQQYRVAEMHRNAYDVLAQRMRAAVSDLDLLARKENARHYFEYQERYMSKGQTAQGLMFQESELAHAPADPRVLGWFQWELYDGKAYGRPDSFPPTAPGEANGLKDELSLAYGATLRERLLRAPYNEDLRAGRGRREAYSHRLVAANEERGKLEEDIQVQQRDGENVRTGYGEQFEQRVREALSHANPATIQIHYTPFAYLARPQGVPGPPLLAYRLVWIPKAFIQWRETKRDRWLIQGYALDPGFMFPTEWERIGTAEILRGDRLRGGDGEGGAIESLAIALGADLAGLSRQGRGTPLEYAPSLSLISRADMAVAHEAWHQARNRYLLLIAGLISVVAVGFGVLVRGVRRELALVRRKEDFIAAITHELKTPLTGIRMYADMLREGWVSSPEAADTYAGRILDETERLGHLVDQVLDLAALERGVAAVHVQPGDLGEAVSGAYALMEDTARQAGVEMTLDIATDLPQISFDPRLVRPLVLNLIDNAIKYSARSDEKSVHVSLQREGERLVLRVTDRGIGIAPKAQKALFEPFQRGGAELTRDAPGVGIGLALVKRYADAHNARVHLTSAAGEGTEVQVRFRL
jgi:signal transduction histidine kinase